jgi:hypothetical protein
MTGPRSYRQQSNRLIHSTSPYLLQHAHNPVDWFPWGEEALARAKAEDRPILLSIGYSACHWCHVMERESFENEGIASLMNAGFVCIKVDREERPDLDDVYMAATLAMNHGQGGWPMTVFLTPEQEPFFAGTYFPPEDRWGRPGFATLLGRIRELWTKDRSSLREQGARLAEYLRDNARPAPGGAPGEDELRLAVTQLSEEFDGRFGGFGGAPKFPPSPALGLLLRCHRRFADPAAIEMVRKTLTEMARGGMYDHLGGGFHRYSVDERWLVPHFEKMLYDNAQLARVYLEAHQATGDGFYRRVATEVLDYVLREMTSPQGGFYSATDADSEGEEGKFFVWAAAEVEAVLGEEEARRFCAYYDVSERGNWEGKNILNTSRTGMRVAKALGLTEEELERSVAASRTALYDARRRRVPPALDDKVLTAWNGLMIAALAEGYRVLGDRRYLEAANRAASFLLATLTTADGRLLRTYRAGKAHLAAYLEDYAYLASALLDLYEASGDARWFSEARRLAERILDEFAAPGGGFYSTARDHEELIVRHREGHDGALPSANAVAAQVLARLSYQLDREDLREAAVRAVEAYGKAITRAPRAYPTSLAAVDLLLEGPVELALVGSTGAEDTEALRREVAAHYLPNRIVAHLDPAREAPALPLLAGKSTVGGRAALYVCRDYACQAPVADPADVAAALDGTTRASGSARTTIRAAHRLSGRATPEGTAGYASRFASRGYRPLGRTGLAVSRVGFGGYRVDDETPEHREALERALLAGCNLIDTSTNYTDGGSERLVGSVLAGLVRGGRLRREEVVVVSKAGYVQGENLRRAEARESSGRPFPEMVKYADGVWHCVHPEFLADQLERSLDRLQLETLDVLLLHNPEYFLSLEKKRRERSLAASREEFYRRLQAAFGFLEGQVAGGRIAAYGVSSNTCTAPADDAEFTSLARFLEAARAAGGPDHHFRVLQLPLNLYESGAVLTTNNGTDFGETVLDHARSQGIAVLANRPLNAFVGSRLIRLAGVPGEPVPETERVDLVAQAATVARLEAEYRGDIAPAIQTPPGALAAADFFRLGEELADLPARIDGLEHWEQVESSIVHPRLVRAVRALDRSLEDALARKWESWRDRYLPQVERLLNEARRLAAGKSRDRADAASARLDPLLPSERRGDSLSRKALWTVASTPGISAALNGMRRPAYVDDALGILAWEPLGEVAPVYRALQG